MEITCDKFIVPIWTDDDCDQISPHIKGQPYKKIICCAFVILIVFSHIYIVVTFLINWTALVNLISSEESSRDVEEVAPNNLVAGILSIKINILNWIWGCNLFIDYFFVVFIDNM